MIDIAERAKVIRETTQYHDKLNPVAWDEFTLKPEVRTALLKVAKHFTSSLFEKNPGLAKGGVLISDIILTGSNANYNWTKYSDFDVHVVVDYLNSFPGNVGGYMGEKGAVAGTDDNRVLIRSLFDLQRRLWNRTHDVRIKGYPVELYYQDSQETHISSGVFSLKRDEWVVKPFRQPPTFHKNEIEAKWRAFVHLINEATDEEELRVVYDKIVQMRKAGLEHAGEFSTENLVFKALRNSKHIEKLIDKLNRVQDETILAG